VGVGVAEEVEDDTTSEEPVMVDEASEALVAEPATV
jgi:hypothetical protein